MQPSPTPVKKHIHESTSTRDHTPRASATARVSELERLLQQQQAENIKLRDRKQNNPDVVKTLMYAASCLDQHLSAARERIKILEEERPREYSASDYELTADDNARFAEKISACDTVDLATIMAALNV